MARRRKKNWPGFWGDLSEGLGQAMTTLGAGRQERERYQTGQAMDYARMMTPILRETWASPEKGEEFLEELQGMYKHAKIPENLIDRIIRTMPERETALAAELHKRPDMGIREMEAHTARFGLGEWDKTDPTTGEPISKVPSVEQFEVPADPSIPSPAGFGIVGGQGRGDVEWGVPAGEGQQTALRLREESQEAREAATLESIRATVAVHPNVQLLQRDDGHIAIGLWDPGEKRWVPTPMGEGLEPYVAPSMWTMLQQILTQEGGISIPGLGGLQIGGGGAVGGAAVDREGEGWGGINIAQTEAGQGEGELVPAATELDLSKEDLGAGGFPELVSDIVSSITSGALDASQWLVGYDPDSYAHQLTPMDPGILGGGLGSNAELKDVVTKHAQIANHLDDAERLVLQYPGHPSVQDRIQKELLPFAIGNMKHLLTEEGRARILALVDQARVAGGKITTVEPKGGISQVPPPATKGPGELLGFGEPGPAASEQWRQRHGSPPRPFSPWPPPSDPSSSGGPMSLIDRATLPTQRRSRTPMPSSSSGGPISLPKDRSTPVPMTPPADPSIDFQQTPPRRAQSLPNITGMPVPSRPIVPPPPPGISRGGPITLPRPQVPPTPMTPPEGPLGRFPNIPQSPTVPGGISPRFGREPQGPGILRDIQGGISARPPGPPTGPPPPGTSTATLDRPFPYGPDPGTFPPMVDEAVQFSDPRMMDENLPSNYEVSDYGPGPNIPHDTAAYMQAKVAEGNKTPKTPDLQHDTQRAILSVTNSLGVHKASTGEPVDNSPFADEIRGDKLRADALRMLFTAWAQQESGGNPAAEGRGQGPEARAYGTFQLVDGRWAGIADLKNDGLLDDVPEYRDASKGERERMIREDEDLSARLAARYLRHQSTKYKHDNLIDVLSSYHAGPTGFRAYIDQGRPGAGKGTGDAASYGEASVAYAPDIIARLPEGVIFILNDLFKSTADTWVAPR